MPRNPSKDIQRPGAIELIINEENVQAYVGETLATVLLAQGITTFNKTPKGQPRGPYCNMGTCFECQVQVAQQRDDSFTWVRACMTTAEPGMTVATGKTLTMLPDSTINAATTETIDPIDNHDN